MKLKTTLCLLLSPLFFLSCSHAQSGKEKTKEQQSDTKNQNEMTEQKEASKFAKTIPPERFKKELENKEGLILDVRTAMEYDAGHIEGARNINVLKPNFKSKVKKLEKDQTIHVYCKSGGRSKKAMSIMKENGFNQIYELDGGITSWQKEGYETTDQ